ncbi:MAG: trypsin-like peptidase domain-containing protein [Clostridia bacterium]|nr:trypsin-like peptidase domain-containing protein [Clostridia bacterium]
MDFNSENNNVKFCSNCGEKLVPGGKFCIKCGKRITPAVQAEIPAAPAAGTPGNDVPEAALAAVSMPTEAVPSEPAENVQPEVVSQPEAVAQNVTAEEAEAAPAAENVPPVQGRVYGVPVDSGNSQDAFRSEVNRYNESRTRYASYDYSNDNVRAASQPQYQSQPQPQTQSAVKERKGLPGWAKALIIVGAVLVIIGFFIVSVTVVKTVLDTVSDLGKRAIDLVPKTSDSTSDAKVGDKTVPSGSDVTINISGDQEMLASAVYAKAKDSVVGIAVYSRSSSSPWAEATNTILAEGSGVVYKSDGYIITNCHVVSMALDKENKLQSGYSVRVYAGDNLGSYYDASIVGVDYTSDLAVLKVDATGLKAAEFESSSSVNIGDTIFVVGCPGGIEFMDSITSGIVGGLNKNIVTSTGYAYDLIQTDAAINPGASGGALVNRNGKVIGICEMKIVEEGYEGMGFAIASDTVTDVCDTLIKDGKVVRPAIGIQVNTGYDIRNASDVGLPAGAWIATVEANTPAAKAGLTADMIITEFNGNTVYNFVSLRVEIMKCKVGDEVTIKAYVFDKNDKTHGTYKTFTLKLQSLEDEYREFD